MKLKLGKQIKTMLLAGVLIVIAFFVAQPHEAFAANDWDSNFTPHGTATARANGGFTLTQDKKAQDGWITLNDKIDTTKDFTITGNVYIGTKVDDNSTPEIVHGGGGYGISFIFHPNDIDTTGYTNADYGPGLGMIGLPNANAFRIKTYWNNANTSIGLPNDWPKKVGAYDDGKGGTPFAGFAKTDGEGKLSYQPADATGNHALATEDGHNWMDGKAKPFTIAYKDGTLSVTLIDVYKNDPEVAGDYDFYKTFTWTWKVDLSDSQVFQIHAFTTSSNNNLQYVNFTSLDYTPKEEARKITVKEDWDNTGASSTSHPAGGYYVLENGDIFDTKTTDAGTSTLVTSTVSDLNDPDKSKYSIKEKDIPDYVTVSTDYVKSTDTYTIKRKYNPKVTFNVNDVWKDNNNPKRPTTSEFSVLANGKELDPTYESSAKNDWSTPVTVPKNDTDGKAITYTVEPKEQIDGYTTTAAKNEDGSFTITHALKSTLTIEFQDENGNPIKDTTLIAKEASDADINTAINIGDTVNLTDTTFKKVQDQLTTLVNDGYTIVKRPENENNLPITEANQTVVYTLKSAGALELKSAPDSISFGTIKYNAKVQRVDKPSYNGDDLVVSDTRTDKTSGWTLSAKMTKQMTKTDDDTVQLVDSLRYYDGTDDKVLPLNQSTPIHVASDEEKSENEINVSSSWKTGDNSKGIKLVVDPKTSAFTKGDYNGEIEWELMEGTP